MPFGFAQDRPFDSAQDRSFDSPQHKSSGFAQGMRALSIRQPYVELILRGIKTAELRTRPTTIIGERFYLYAAKAKSKLPVWSDDLEVGKPPAWMIELAKQVRMIESSWSLPTGLILGTAVIKDVIQIQTPDAQGGSPMYAWQLTDVKRISNPRAPTRHPQPSWFRPF